MTRQNIMLPDATHLLVDATLPENNMATVATGSMSPRRNVSE